MDSSQASLPRRKARTKIRTLFLDAIRDETLIVQVCVETEIPPAIRLVKPIAIRGGWASGRVWVQCNVTDDQWMIDLDEVRSVALVDALTGKIVDSVTLAVAMS